MKIFIRILCVVAVISALSFLGSVLYEKQLDNKIGQLEAACEQKRAVVNSMIAAAYHTDEQSEDECEILEKIFENIFTFYDMEDFNAAREAAVSYGLPDDFVNAFYSKDELSNMCAESMIDVMCRYDSSEIYLLDRSDNIGYYYAVVTLNPVKYGGQFFIGVFVSLETNSDDSKRIASFVYYNIE